MTLLEAIPLILLLAALEGILSADNAMVLAVLVRPLPVALRKKALLYGIVGAYVLRGVALSLAYIITKFWWIQLLGAAYLLYLPAKHFLSHGKPLKPPSPGESISAGFWKIVALVEITDLAFAVDSVLVAVALSEEMWVIITGVFLGILLLRIAAGAFVGLLDKFPRFEHVAYIMVGWAGVKLGIEGWEHFMEERGKEHLALHVHPSVFYAVTFTLLILGSIWALRHREERGREPESVPLDDPAATAESQTEQSR